MEPKDIEVGYSDFVQLLRIESSEDLRGLDLRPDGVYVAPPPLDEILLPNERAVLSEHPENDLRKPVLAFPCVLSNPPKPREKDRKLGLVEFLEQQGLYGSIDAFDAIEWALGKFDSAAAPKHDTNLLNIVRWVIATYWEGKDPAKGPPKELVVEKLKDLHSLTQNEAEAVDLVTRPDSRRRSSPKVPPTKPSNRAA
jgi:hypothetical protein